MGEIQRGCFHHVAPAVNSAAALPQDCAPWIGEGESCTSSLGIWHLCHHHLTLLTLPGGTLGAPTAFEDEHSNFSNTLWKTNGLVFPHQLTPSKGPRALLGKHLQLQLQDSRLRGLCVIPALPYSILPSRNYLERKSNCLETAEIN